MHEVSLKKEEDVPVGGHPHYFEIKFNQEDTKYTIECKQPCTVMKAIKSHMAEELAEKNVSAKNILIKLGDTDNSPIIATHFPCCCIENGVCLVIYTSKKVVEAQRQRKLEISPKEQYSIFYIDKEGGKNSKSKSNQIFRCTIPYVDFGYYCVYGEKEMTVENAIRQDGRFHDDLVGFFLSDKNKTETITKSTETVAGLHQKKFKVCLPKEKKKNPKQQTNQKQQEQICLPIKKNKNVEKPTRSILDVVRESGKSVKKAMEQSGRSVDHNEIYERLRQQFPELKEWMESRFPDGSYKKVLDLKKENFGKIQQAFSEVHRIKKLLKMGESVCKVVVENACQGTGFVLFDNFILTNAHLFKDCLEGRMLKEHIDVFALFNFDDPVPNTNYFYFTAEKSLLDIDEELDYAVFKLKPEGQKSNQQTRAENIKVPPGLLKKFGPTPENGEACIIGHPARGVKKIDPTCIIEPEKREKAVKDHLAPYQHMYLVHSIIQQIKDQGIEEIMMGGAKAEKVSTYNTFMYHGASGSPVFDAHCQLFGLHTAGYCYGCPEMIDSVLEYAQPLLTIFENFVFNLKESGNDEMLERVKEEVGENQKLREILKVEPMEME